MLQPRQQANQANTGKNASNINTGYLSREKCLQPQYVFYYKLLAHCPMASLSNATSKVQAYTCNKSNAFIYFMQNKDKFLIGTTIPGLQTIPALIPTSTQPLGLLEKL